MDKETLSHYGWIVILVLILAVMLALASPFGTFVAGAIKSTTAGLFDVNQNALGVAGINVDKVLFETCEHDYQTDVVVDCNTIGTITYTCTKCGGTYAEEKTSAQHTFDNASDLTCNVCNVKFTEYAFIATDYDAKMGTTTIIDENVIIPETFECDGVNYKVTSIAYRGFYECESLVYIEFPNSLKSIGRGAFEHCSSLKSIIIPDSVTTIDRYAFSNCYALESAYISKNMKEINGDVFLRCYSLNNVIIPDGVNSIGSCAFHLNNSLTTITLPSSLRFISSDAFNGSIAIETVNFKGTEEEWSKLSIGSNNQGITNANIVFNYVEK